VQPRGRPREKGNENAAAFAGTESQVRDKFIQPSVAMSRASLVSPTRQRRIT
jgi:hypothetical protein